MNSITQIPEIAALSSPPSLLRIPDQLDVAVTPRIQRLIDCPEFQRLRGISQLGLVSRVYPGATHSRFEHSLGAYRMGLQFLRKLASVPEFVEVVDEQAVVTLILATLLHDVGHYPFCHPIEDLNHSAVKPHEMLAREYIASDASEIRQVISNEFGIDAERVIQLIERRGETATDRLLGSILSGPIDIDKMDYLYRDSLHAGVPYGRHFDSPRLIGSLCVNRERNRLAITEKGRTAAELLVFARYVMFSEVYWHHAVRAATAMFQRSVYEMWLEPESSFPELDSAADSQLVEMILEQADQQAKCQRLVRGLFGPRRRLYKRLLAFSCLENEPMYRKLARRPYPWLVECSRHLASVLSRALATDIRPDWVLIDAPPVGLEVQFDVDVYYRRADRYRSLGEVSPVVHTLARTQFDDLVKQVRVFVDPEVVTMAADQPMMELLEQAIAETTS